MLGASPLTLDGGFGAVQEGAMVLTSQPRSRCGARNLEFIFRDGWLVAAQPPDLVKTTHLGAGFRLLG
jgi:hypothetical protein